MLPHHYVQRKADILAKAKTELDNLLTEIDNPTIKAFVEDWEPGDPIVDEYPQVDQKKDEPEAQHAGETIHTDIDMVTAAAQKLTPAQEPVAEPKAVEPAPAEEQHSPAADTQGEEQTAPTSPAYAVAKEEPVADPSAAGAGTPE